MIIPKAEPFFFPGDQTGCLLVHGFTGTPKEMRWLGEQLAIQGRSVMGIRLAGHATQVQDMNRSHWQDWLANLEDGYHLLSGSAKNIFLIGLSLGGILTSILASDRYLPRLPVAGLVILSTPYSLPISRYLAPFIKPISLFYPYRSKAASAWRDQDALKQHICYPQDPIKVVAELNELLQEMRIGLSQVKCPVLMIYSKDDPVVTTELGHADKIYQALGSREKQLVWIEDSDHVIICDKQRQIVFDLIADFIAKEHNNII